MMRVRRTVHVWMPGARAASLRVATGDRNEDIWGEKNEWYFEFSGKTFGPFGSRSEASRELQSEKTNASLRARRGTTRDNAVATMSTKELQQELSFIQREGLQNKSAYKPRFESLVEELKKRTVTTSDDAITPWLKTVLQRHQGGRLVGNSVLVGSRVVATWRGTPESSTTSDATKQFKTMSVRELKDYAAELERDFDKAVGSRAKEDLQQEMRRTQQEISSR